MWTLNNYTDEEEVQLKSLPCRAMLYGYENGEQNDTPHLQGVTLFNTLKSVGQVIKILPKRCSNIQMIENLPMALAYCKKGDQSKEEWKESNVKGPNYGAMASFVEQGDFPMTVSEKGQKGTEYWNAVLTNLKNQDIESVPAQVQICYRNACNSIMSESRVCPEIMKGDLPHLWLFGRAGSGKSKWAFDTYPDLFEKAADTKWWCGYQGQEVVLIDDFDKYHIKQGYHLKKWADRYPFNAEMKGSSLKIRPALIIVTSNYEPEDIWSDEKTIDPIKRRFRMVDTNVEHWQEALALSRYLVKEKKVQSVPAVPRVVEAEDSYESGYERKKY